MNRDEEICFFGVGHGRALFERDKRIVGSREDDLAAQSALDELAEPLGDVEHQVFLSEAMRSDGPGVFSTMAGVDHDFAEFQPEHTYQRAIPLAIAGCRRGLAQCRSAARGYVWQVRLRFDGGTLGGCGWRGMGGQYY